MNPSPQSTPTPRQATLLARLLAEAMIANVQHTTALNRSAADLLLAQARLPVPDRFGALEESWQHSWRSFERTVSTADRLIGLTRGHVERSTSGLWRVTERLLMELAQLPGTQLQSLRDAFAVLRDAQAHYLEATQQAHRRLVALADLPKGSSDARQH